MTFCWCFHTRERFACVAPDAILFAWVPSPHLAIAFDLLRLRGFSYKSHLIWRKDKVGTGYWVRSVHEVLLIATRGRVPAPARGTQPLSVIDAPRGRHSEKPAAIRALIDRLYPSLPRLELNARGAVPPNWTAWGV